jgi:hypothetical protein
MTRTEREGVWRGKEQVALPGESYEVWGQTWGGHADSEVDAHDGSQVWAQSGSEVNAHDGSVVHAYSGSDVIADVGSTVNAHDGSHVVGLPGSRVNAYSSSVVRIHPGSQVAACPGADVDGPGEIVSCTHAHTTR